MKESGKPASADQIATAISEGGWRGGGAAAKSKVLQSIGQMTRGRFASCGKAQSLPHYTHLIGLHAVRKAASDRFSRTVERADVFEALKEAVKQAEHTVREKHSRATHSAHKDALYRHVLLPSGIAAATSHDSLGYFNPSSLVGALETILDRSIEIAAFNNHLAEFCKSTRGSVLERIGHPRSYRYRFQDPLLVPFVFMDAIATGLITDQSLAELLGEPF